MADYPSVMQSVGSTVEFLDGTVVDRAVSGKPRFRTYFSGVWAVFRIQHELENADKLLIDTHYSAHRFVEFNFTWSGDGNVYKARYASPPATVPIEGDYRWRIQTILIGTQLRSVARAVSVGVSSSIVVVGVKA